MRGEDTHDQLLRRLTEYQNRIIEVVARGDLLGIESYYQMTGQVKALDQAIGLVREILFGDRPAEPKSAVDYGAN